MNAIISRIRVAVIVSLALVTNAAIGHSQSAGMPSSVLALSCSSSAARMSSMATSSLDAFGDFDVKAQAEPMPVIEGHLAMAQAKK